MANPLRDSSRHDDKKAARRTSIAPRRRWISGLDPGQYSMARRPTFGRWLKTMIPDFFGFAAMGAIAWGVFRLPPAFSRSFPLTFANGEVVYPQFAYPYRDQIVAAWVASVLGSLVPIAAILLCNIRIRSFWDINNGIIGLLYSLLCATAFQVMCKIIIGGLRPTFYEVCKPDPSLAPNFNSSGLQGVGYAQLMFTREICTADSPDGINNALESFPSGHTTASFSGFVYLHLYLNAKLKVFADYHPALWKMILLYAPILLATLIGGSLTVDRSHNWYDVLAGAIIGTTFAVSSYRMVYAGLWDWRINHIPLNRTMPLDHAAGRQMEGFDYVITRKAGWGVDHLSGFENRRRTHSSVGLGTHHDQHGNGNLHHHTSHGAHGSSAVAARGREHETTRTEEMV